MTETARLIVDTLRPHFSFSQLSLFLKCSMQYYFRYILGVREQPSLDLTRGSAGHHALEINGKHKIQTKRDLSAEEIIDTFSTAFDKEIAEYEKDDLELGDNPGKTKDETIEVLRGYRLDKKDGALATMPLAIELEFTARIPPTDDQPDEIKPITGKIDRIEKRKRIVVPNGKPVERTTVVDYKFPRRKPSNTEQLAELSDQLTMYDYVLTAAGSPTQDLGFVHLIPPLKTIGPRIETTFRHPSQLTNERRASRHARLLYKLRQAARQIQAGIFMPVDDPRVCGYCPYRKICQYSLAKDDYTALLARGRHT